jgi:hypothetical protein
MATDTQENSGAENSTNAVERDSVYFLEPVVFQVRIDSAIMIKMKEYTRPVG